MSGRVDSKQKQAQPLADEDGSGEEEAQEPQRRCQVCNDVPASIICLTCSHSIDIPCAARVIIESAGNNQPDIGSVQCQECGTITDLSEEVQGAILNFLSQGLEEEFGEEENGGNEEAGENEYQDEDGEEEQDYKDDDQNEEEGPIQPEPKLEYRTIHGSGKGTNTQNSRLPDQKVGNQPSRTANSSTGFQRGQTQPENNRATPKRSSSDLKESVSQVADLSLRFVCLEHPSDEYAYYSSLKRKLYCAQCILANDVANKVKDLKPLKRCLPLIMQHFTEMLNEVKVSRNLLSNRRRDLQIRLEDLSSKLEGIKNSEILRLEELLERLEVLKHQFLENYEQKVKGLLVDVAEQSDNLDEKLEFLENVEKKIDELQQEVIRNFLQEQSEQKLMTRLRTNCESAELKAKAFCETELLKVQSQISRDMGEIFKDLSRKDNVKDGILRLEREFANNRVITPPSYVSRSPQKIEASSVGKSRATPVHPSENGGRWTNNVERLSGSDSKLPYRNTWGRSPEGGVDGFAGQVSRPASGKHPRAEQREAAYEPRNLGTEPRVATTTESRGFSFSRDKRPGTPTVGGTSGKGVSPSAGSGPGLLRAVENPFSEIEKKLAVFDIKNPSNRLIRGSASTQGQFGGESRYNKGRTSPMVDGWRPGPEGLRGLPEPGHSPNIDNLRCFRQKIRDRIQAAHPRHYVPLF